MKNFVKIIIAYFLAIFMLIPCFIPAASAEEFFLSENYAHKKTVSANNAYSKGPATNAVDGDFTTLWRTVSSCPHDYIWFVVRLKELTRVNLLRLALFNQQNMQNLKFQYTTAKTPANSSQWQDICVIEKEDISSMMTVSFEAVEATGLRVYADLSDLPVQTAGMYEFQVYYSNDPDKGAARLEQVEFYDYTLPDYVDGKIVSVDESGNLVYADVDGKGGRLLDYSRVGYKNGEEPLPDVPVVMTLEPGEQTDHSTMIQTAISRVAAMPEDQRGAILLKAGTYILSSPLTISASGIVLRGEGQGENGTILYDARKVNSECTLKIAGNASYSIVSGTTGTVQDAYLPMGETTFHMVESRLSKYQVGDSVLVTYTPNSLWVKTLGMDVIPGTSAQQWTPGSYVMKYERTVTAVDVSAGTITLDAGIPLTLDKTYYQATLAKITDSPSRIRESGVENLRFVSQYNGSEADVDHVQTAVAFTNCRNCYMNGVTARYYSLAAANVLAGSINVTVQNSSYIDPISPISGGWRYSFHIGGGQYTLIQNCYSSEARHDYVIGARVCSPNVFLNCIAENSNDVSEPHQRWSTGTLYDNMLQTGTLRLGCFQAINRGNSGTGHGWAGANMLFWNCLSPAIVVRKPQTEQNFAVGVYGIYETADPNAYMSFYKDRFVTPSIETPNYPDTVVYPDSPLCGNGYIESPYNPVNPSSLYRAQLSYRLYGDAREQIRPNAPVLEYPVYDAVSKSYEVEFSGTHDRNADQVFVVVDGERYEAILSDDGSFHYAVNLYLGNGYHDVCVVQVAGDMESLPNAMRTILIDSSDSFDEALVSLPYGEEKEYPVLPGQDTTSPSGETETGEVTSPDPQTSAAPKPSEEVGTGLYGILALCAVGIVALSLVVLVGIKKKNK